jgi:hypothetical protein
MRKDYGLILAVLVISISIGVVEDQGIADVTGKITGNSADKCEPGPLNIYRCHTYATTGDYSGRVERRYRYNNCQLEWFTLDGVCENGCNVETGQCS